MTINNQQLTDLFITELIATFFSSLTEFDKMAKAHLDKVKGNDEEIEAIRKQLMGQQVDEDLQLAYDSLFCGTDYEKNIPLWTSACKNTVPILLDETTLSVVHFYHQWGYAPELINGNPPDYIGTQLKFIAYLKGCILHAEKAGKAVAAYEQAMVDFVQLSLVDTVNSFAAALMKETQEPLYVSIAEYLLRFTAAGCMSQMTAVEALDVSDISGCASYKAMMEGQNNPIPNEERKVVKTGGFNNCGGRCVIHGHVQDNCVLEITSDCSENAPQIRACVRGRGYRYTYFNTDRLRYPMKRVGKRGEGKFKRISWEEAIDTIYKEWVRITRSYGPASRFVMYSWGVSAMMRPDNMIKRLMNLDGGFLGAYNTYSDACTVYISPYIYGDSTCGNGAEDILNTNLLILWGHNPAETIFGAEKNYYITKAREQGVKIIVIDPRQSETALTYGDEWIGIRPSTDSALADGMAYVIWTEGLMDKAFMDKYCIGFDKDHMPEGVDGSESYEAYLLGQVDGTPKTPEWAAEITGVPAEKIVELARAYATTKPACIMPGLGLQRTGNGEQTTRSLAMLACLTGNVGISGGGSGASIWEKSGATCTIPTLENPYPGQIPNFLWSKAVKEGAGLGEESGVVGVDKLDSNIKMIFNLAGNTLINQHGNINETAAILQDETKCEFIVCSDVFMTPSTRFADILLPAASGFENDNMTAPWLNGDYVLYNNKMREPFFECQFEWQWIRKLAEKLGYQEAFDEGHPTTDAWMRDLYKQTQEMNKNLPSYDTIKETGIWRWKKEKPFVAYEENIKDFENHPFNTPSGKIEIYSQALKDRNNPEEIPAIPRYVACPEGPEDRLRETYPLQLIGWHTKRRCHSIHDNNKMMEEVEPQRVWIHKDDAKARGIEEGDLVRVFNDRGIVEIKAHLTDRIVSGVCAISQGAWYTPNKDGVDTRGCINVLTSTRPTPIAKGNAQHTNLVEVKKVTK